MPLSVRSTPYTVPTYSLTGDLLAYLNCGLQYRYQNKGALPPSKPVQLWFGQFIHGVMEEAYRTWQTQRSSLPWGDGQILPIINLIIRRLNARGLSFQRYQLLAIAIERAFASINTWGPYLFPLISEAEVRLKGIRPMPPGTMTIRSSNYYEIEGVVDVITSFRLSAAPTSNPIAEALLAPVPNESYEVVVDYKGMRRPSLPSQNDSLGPWQYQEWQILTYAWLRSQQPDAASVRSGILLYLNELVPGLEDMDRLYEEVFGTGAPRTDELPFGDDYKMLRQWTREKANWQKLTSGWVERVQDWWQGMRSRNPADPFPQFPRMPTTTAYLSEGYHLRRSLRLVAVRGEQVNSSVDAFDRVISTIERCVAVESRGSRITTTWMPNPQDETCTVCDFKTFCPATGNSYKGTPAAP